VACQPIIRSHVMSSQRAAGIRVRGGSEGDAACRALAGSTGADTALGPLRPPSLYLAGRIVTCAEEAGGPRLWNWTTGGGGRAVF